MNRFIASIAGIAVMAVASVAAADCISTCENNCTFLGDPGSIGLCIASCPATCALPPPRCDSTGGVNFCTSSPLVVTPSGIQFTISKEGSGTARGYMTLICRDFGINTTVFQGGQTITGTQRVGRGCVRGGIQRGNASSSTCGPTTFCSNGVENNTIQ